MSFEEAISSPGRLVQLCDAKVVDGSRILEIYRVSDDGAEELAVRRVPEGKYKSLVEELNQRGLEKAESDTSCHYIWVIGASSLEVYGMSVKLFDATADQARIENGRIILRSDIARVIAFTEANYVYRGLKAELRSGEQVPLVTEDSMAAEAGAGYSRNDFLMEIGWTGKLGVAIANWAGASYESLILG